MSGLVPTPAPGSRSGVQEGNTEALAKAEQVRAAKEVRGMGQAIKALFQGEPSLAHLPGEYTDESGVQRMNRRSPKQPGDHPARRRATDPVRVTANHLEYEALDDPDARVPARPMPGPWDGVPAAVQTLRPLGRYDRVTDDAWRLVNAFCEARAQDRDDS